MGHLTKAHFEQILSRATTCPKTYVETGCNRGNQLSVAQPLFARCYGIELDEHYAAEAEQRVPAARVYRGDTREFLPSLLAGLQEPVFVILDAHYCALNPPIKKSPFPLWDELILLRARPYADIVVVDDVHTFGKVRDDLRFADAPEWEGVTTASVSSFLGAPGYALGDGYVVHLPERR